MPKSTHNTQDTTIIRRRNAHIRESCVYGNRIHAGIGCVVCLCGLINQKCKMNQDNLSQWAAGQNALRNTQDSHIINV